MLFECQVAILEAISTFTQSGLVLLVAYTAALVPKCPEWHCQW